MSDSIDPSKDTDKGEGSQPAPSEALTPLQEARRQLRRAERLVEEGKRDKRRAARLQEEVNALQTRLARMEAGDTDGGIKPENIVWIFGSGRTGSSWLAFMLGELPETSRWNEPLVGDLFGHHYHKRAKARANDPTDRHFILGSDRPTWLGSVRAFVLDGAAARFPQRTRGGYLVVKEPHGATGAPLLLEALPESRLVFLVRHPGDVVASTLDAHRGGSWAFRRSEREDTVADANPDRFVALRAKNYLEDVELVGAAYEAHRGPKAFLRYEDLRADPTGVLGRVCAELGLEVANEDIRRAVAKHAWENMPEAEKGQGKIRRKATPGTWQEDLTPEQARLVEETCAPLIRRFYA